MKPSSPLPEPGAPDTPTHRGASETSARRHQEHCAISTHPHSPQLEFHEGLSGGLKLSATLLTVSPWVLSQMSSAHTCDDVPLISFALTVLLPGLCTITEALVRSPGHATTATITAELRSCIERFVEITRRAMHIRR